MSIKQKTNRIMIFSQKFFSQDVLVEIIIVASFFIKLGMIFYYGNALTLNSDDENYIRTARILLERRTFVYYNLNEPTVFITPVFPMFIAFVFRIFGSGFIGMQATRIAQAILSSITLVYIYLIAKDMFNKKTAVVAILFAGFYPPNIVTVGYFLTETLFMFLLYALIYHFIYATKQEKSLPYVMCGLIWGIATLCRPVIALLPSVFYLYEIFVKKTDFLKVFKVATIMVFAFIVIMLPWWVRNFIVFRDFIPLAESGGNPMLQGTYINYDQSNPTVYARQETERKQNKEEIRVAKLRIIDGFKNNTLEYVKWYTLGKTRLLWKWPFYWKEFLGITRTSANLIHSIILSGFVGMGLSLFYNFRRYSFYALIVLYFNVSYCAYMTFDRYGYPLMPIVTIFFAHIIVHLFAILKRVINKGDNSKEKLIMV